MATSDQNSAATRTQMGSSHLARAACPSRVLGFSQGHRIVLFLPPGPGG